MPRWTVEYLGDDFERFYLKLPTYEQAVLTAAITHVLEAQGMDAFDGGWGKPLGGGLFEFRVQRSLDSILSPAGVEEGRPDASSKRVSLRLFCTFHGDRIVLLFHGYDKGRDPSRRRQQKQIARARKALAAWKRNG